MQSLKAVEICNKCFYLCQWQQVFYYIFFELVQSQLLNFIHVLFNLKKIYLTHWYMILRTDILVLLFCYFNFQFRYFVLRF